MVFRINRLLLRFLLPPLDLFQVNLNNKLGLIVCFTSFTIVVDSGDNVLSVLVTSPTSDASSLTAIVGVISAFVSFFF